MTEFSEHLEAFLCPNQDGIINVPIMIKGQLVYPPQISIARLIEACSAIDSRTMSTTSNTPLAFKIDDVQVIRHSIFDRSTFRATGKHQFLVFACPAPQQLIERNPAELARDLYNLPFSEVLQYVDLLQKVLVEHKSIIRHAAQTANNVSFLDDRVIDIVFEQLPLLLDSQALAVAVDRELGGIEEPGRNYLDTWVEIDAPSHRGMMSYMRDSIFKDQPSATGFTPRVRAIPTRQLHITAGNAPMLPFLSFLRVLASKGASVIKSPIEVTAISAILAITLRVAAPDHPITRHTSFVYWKGGDHHFEQALFAPEAFDRLVIWGSPETVDSVRKRVHNTKTIFLNPRFGLSLIAREAFPLHLQEAALRACSDSLIANQRACTSSLVHYVAADEQQTLDYCHALQKILAQWDKKLPHAIPRAIIGKLRMLRRKEFFKGTWFENGSAPDITSSVVYMPEPFDISVHPMCRCIVVRRIDDDEDILPFLNSSVSTIGIFPEQTRFSLCNQIAAAGVSNILPLGDCERVYAGMPHDGMRILSELVNWTNA